MDRVTRIRDVLNRVVYYLFRNAVGLRITSLVLACGSFIICSFLPIEPREAAFVLGVTLAVAILWITNTIPMAITALIPVFAFPLLGIMNGTDAAKSYINTTSMIFIGGFIMALAMERWLLHQRIALKILIWTGKITRLPLILAGFMGTSYLMSMWLSNTATALIMCPNAGAIIERLRKLLLDDPNIREDEFEKREKAIHNYEVALFLGIAYSCNIGGISTLVGTPPNLIFSEQYEILFGKSYSAPSSLQWFLLGFPLSLVFVLILYGYFMLRYVRSTMKLVHDYVNEQNKQLLENNSISESQQVEMEDVELGESNHVELPVENVDLGMSVFKTEYQKMGPILYEEIVIVVLFLALVVLWMTRTFWQKIPIFKAKFIDDGTVAILVSIFLFLIPSRNKAPTGSSVDSEGASIMSWAAMTKFPWDIILIFGGGFALSNGFQVSTLTKVRSLKFVF
jgi:sodium-dependent dicarboxylate transporter 2/3/5